MPVAPLAPHPTTPTPSSPPTCTQQRGEEVGGLAVGVHVDDGAVEQRNADAQDVVDAQAVLAGQGAVAAARQAACGGQGQTRPGGTRVATALQLIMRRLTWW
jgi:hypothetical protein